MSIAPQSEDSPSFQLRIVHFLIWMAASGAILTAYRLIEREDAHLNQWQSVLLQCLWMFNSTIYGACIGGALFIVAARFRRSFRLAPGHWMLVLQSLKYFVSLVAWLIVMASLGTDEERSQPPTVAYLLCLAVLNGTMGLIYFAILFVYREPARWRIALAGVSLFNLFSAFLLFLDLINFYPRSMGLYRFQRFTQYGTVGFEVFVAVLLLVAALGDRGKIARDALHWLGIAVMICSSLTHAFVPIVFRMLR